MRVLDYMLPKEDFQLNGTTEKMDERCEWCGNLELNVPKRTKSIHTVYAVKPHRGEDDRWVFCKGREAYELYCMVRGIAYLVAERGISGDDSPEWRKFIPRPGFGHIWARDEGGEFLSDFDIEEYSGCGVGPSRTVRAVLSSVQTGPLTLSNRDHLAELSRIMGKDAQDGISLLQTLPEQVGHGDRPLKVLAIEQYWGGSYDASKIHEPGDHKETYLYACVRAGGKLAFTFGPVGWLKFAWLDNEWVLMRRTIWHEVIWPDEPFRTPDHCGLV